MKTYVKNMLLFSLILTPVISQAAEAGWTVSSKVVKLVVTQNGGINVRLSPELSGCTSQSGYGAKYASIYHTHPGIKAIHANLLAAYMSNKDVSLWLKDANCTVGEMTLGGTHSS